MANFYDDRLRSLLADPNSFASDPGYQFTRDQGLQAVNRSNSRQRGSFNALADLVKYGSGLAAQTRGQELERLGNFAGMQNQYDLGAEQNRLTGIRDANAFTLGAGQNDIARMRAENDYSLGQGQNANTAQKNAWDYSLGSDQNANARRIGDQNFGLGMYRAGNDYALGAQQNANTAQNNWWNYDLGQGQNANNAARNANDYSINSGRNMIDWYNAGTNRGTARSNDYYRGDQSAQEWQKLNPPRRIV